MPNSYSGLRRRRENRRNLVETEKCWIHEYGENVREADIYIWVKTDYDTDYNILDIMYIVLANIQAMLCYGIVFGENQLLLISQWSRSLRINFWRFQYSFTLQTIFTNTLISFLCVLYWILTLPLFASILVIFWTIANALRILRKWLVYNFSNSPCSVTFGILLSSSNSFRHLFSKCIVILYF